MDLTKVLAQLRLELDHINSAILSLEHLQAIEARRAKPAKGLVDIRKFRPAPRRAGASTRQTKRTRPDG